MKRKYFSLYFTFIYLSLLMKYNSGIVLTNLCPQVPCNCILTDDISLEIICSSSVLFTELPELNNGALQTDVIALSIRSSTSGDRGPLTSLPTNICSSYPNVAKLDLSSNSINGTLNTSHLVCLGSNLLQADFSNNFIDNIDGNLFKGNNKIELIDLSRNNLTAMPKIDIEYFLTFPSTNLIMNLSYNQITDVDFWPLFVRTGRPMTVDLSYNLIRNYVNQVPVYVRHFNATPDPRNFYLNDNQIERLSDSLLQQYGACPTLSSISTSYFIVGISNIYLADNPLICDCQSYNLVKFLNDRIADFPEINNGSTPLTQAVCTSPLSTIGQKYIFSNFSAFNACANYILPNQADIYCSVYTNQIRSTLAPPVYTLRTTTILTTRITTNETATTSRAGEETDRTSSNSSSPAWYIILGIIIGVAVIIGIILIAIFLFKDYLLPKRFRSKFSRNEIDSHENFLEYNQSNRHESRRGFLSRFTSRWNNMYESDNDETNWRNKHQYWNNTDNRENGTQTSFPITRSAPSTTKPSRILRNRTINIENNSSNESKSATIQKSNGIKGIPIPSKATKTTQNDNNTSGFDLNVTPIPLTPSKRAKILPQIKSGMYFDSSNINLLNTSANALMNSQKQSHNILMRFRPDKQDRIPLSISPIELQTMKMQKNALNHDMLSSTDDNSSPVSENLNEKSLKPLRSLPLLNITIVPAWLGNKDDQ